MFLIKKEGWRRFFVWYIHITIMMPILWTIKSWINWRIYTKPVPKGQIPSPSQLKANRIHSHFKHSVINPARLIKTKQSKISRQNIRSHCVKYHPDPNLWWKVMIMASTFPMCKLWPWPWRHDIRSNYYRSFGHGQRLCEILSKSNISVVSYGPDKKHGCVCKNIHDLGDMIFGHGHDTPLGHWQ